MSTSFSDWKVGSNYEIEKILGEGSYGAVARAICKSNGTKVAIKRIGQIFDDLIDGKRILREVAILRRLKNPYIANIIEIIKPEDLKTFQEIYIVLEYAPSDLKKLLKSPNYLEMAHINTIMYSILLGLKAIHAAGVLHRDLKPANVLVQQDCSAKICDLGLARTVEKTSQSFSTKGKAEEDDILGSLPSKDKKPTTEKKGLKKNPASAGTAAGGASGAPSGSHKTAHVATRWYRAPELILIEKDYDGKIDLWSVACIYAELLLMLKEHAATPQDRAPLFPGQSCFPLSPDTSASTKINGFPVTKKDQLNVILEILGTPSGDELSFITDDKALEYLKAYPTHPKQTWKALFPAAPEASHDFLEKTLRFNPHKRLSVAAAVSHPVFDEVREPSKEDFSYIKPFMLDFENTEIDTEAKLRSLFVEEIKAFHP